VPRGSELQLYIENDTLSGTDRYYTNGIKFGGGVPADALIGLFKGPTGALLQQISTSAAPVHFGLFLGQNMYTPRRIAIAAPQPFDRPWAAWLYLGGVAQRVEQLGAHGGRLETVELDLGVVGPAALGKRIQTGWHDLIGVDEPRGWGNQIRNEPGILATYLQKQRFPIVERYVDVVPHFGASVGNVMTLARAGGILRFGMNLTGFGPDSIEPGGAMLQNTRRDDKARGGSEWYVFAGGDMRAVGYNVFLDGPVLRDGPSVDRKPFVYDLTAGFSLRVQSVRFSLTHIRRSPEFSTPLGEGARQSFQSLNLGWEW
jgi:lipid A 3-O-deacylase